MPSYPELVWNSDEAVETDEFFNEMDETDEMDEAARRQPQRRMRAPIKTPTRGGNVPPRPATGFATRAELTATANRLDAKIGQVSTGIKALDGRVRTLDTEQSRLRTALAAETKKREALSGQINNVQQMSMLMPLLTTQSTRNVTAPVAGTGLTTNDKVVIDNGDSLSRILPMLLFSGAGNTGGQSGSGGMFGGDNNTMMMLAMVMAMKP
jgi:hypothetical protein